MYLSNDRPYFYLMLKLYKEEVNGVGVLILVSHFVPYFKFDFSLGYYFPYLDGQIILQWAIPIN